MGGFECSSQRNGRGKRMDYIACTQHDRQAHEDYRRLKNIGFSTARDGLRWHLIDRCGSYDWSSFEPMFCAALDNDVEVIWDLFHYGFAEGIDPFSAGFIRRFASFAGAAARFMRERTDDTLWFSPANEISFFSWAGCRDGMWPCASGRDGELKEQLVSAALAAVEAIWSVEPRARICWPEPMVSVTAPPDSPELREVAVREHESQYEAWDMIATRWPEALDVVGVNYYFGNQWVAGTREFLHWEPERRDHRWKPVPRMLADVHRRYGRPIFVAETGHFGTGRAGWIEDVTGDVVRARQQGVPVEGICIYPLLDRHDWFREDHWHNSGLWDLKRLDDGRYERVLNTDYASALQRCRKITEDYLIPSSCATQG